MENRSAATASLALIALLLLAGCSGGAYDNMSGMDHGSASSVPPASSGPTDADVMFATMMIPHHEQAIEMSDTLLAIEGIDERITAFAEEIKAAQQPEMDKMQGWLDAWGADSTGMDAVHHANGMMSADDMQMLESATGTEAAQLFLSQMISHHRGAVDMAQAEIENGSDTAAVALARTIVNTQMAEIAEMEQLQSAL